LTVRRVKEELKMDFDQNVPPAVLWSRLGVGNYEPENTASLVSIWCLFLEGITKKHETG